MNFVVPGAHVDSMITVVPCDRLSPTCLLTSLKKTHWGTFFPSVGVCTSIKIKSHSTHDF